jgi:hypothetical protein
VRIGGVVFFEGRLAMAAWRIEPDDALLRLRSGLGRRG